MKSYPFDGASHRGAGMRVPGYCLLLIAGTLCACCLWKMESISRWSSNMRAKIHFDLSIPSAPSSSSSSSRHPFRDRTDVKPDDLATRRKHRGTLSRYMIQLYKRRPDADIVRAIQPAHTSSPLDDGGRILEFAIPPIGNNENLEGAELLGIAGAIVRVRSFTDATARNGSARMPKSRKDDTWRVFDVTSAVAGKNGNTVRLYVHGKLTYRPYGDTPILLLNYSKKERLRRHRRSLAREDREEDTERWEEDAPRRRRRNACRRRPMYVDFALIAYDEWVIAPPGYEAYQCSGKCLYPLGDHLSPTKHAIVQTLVHGALQASDLAGGKFVGRPCCVPTRLAPTSLLYLDGSGTLTYQYGYEDMVVAECGCR